MNTPSTELLLRVNGVQAAFGIELGFASPRADEGRAADPYRQANVSYSLVQRRNGEVVRHTLIDVGMGVVPSLLEFEVTHDVHVVHEVVITHPHFDHFAQLDWLSMALLRNCRGDQPRPLPIYATEPCWETGPNAIFRYLAERSEFRPIQFGSVIMLGDVLLTPFAVDHGPKAPGASGFVIQHGERKIVLTGDFLHVPDKDDPLLSGADLCFMDANTWHPADWTSHQSVLGNLRLIDKWKPKRAYFVHYSGYEDMERDDDPINGPMAMPRLRDEVRGISDGRDLRVAEHGMILGNTVEWPE
ncbi:MAG: MBL fold metallo-hydrolase [Planctomycetes bacterium]|nr:MBL fold metallo-hydrolase [Planctomycetota bacterium]MBL7042035.1 MBL fold metallo-hydrolase [Pirellulaceae bacterium]